MNNYPSQYEAQLILDTMQALDNIHTGYASESKTKGIINTAHESVRQEFVRVFQDPEKSPWEVIVKRRGGVSMRFIKWRDAWEYEEQA